MSSKFLEAGVRASPDFSLSASPLVSGMDNKSYVRLYAAVKADAGTVEPEARPSTGIAGSIVFPIGLFLFAWTTYPSEPCFSRMDLLWSSYR